MLDDITSSESLSSESTTSAPAKARPAPGQRRVQILQTLAQMLESPNSERITTALLAKRLDVSEAALYRHFASKAQMFEGLLEFIESSVFGLINQITEREPSAVLQCKKIVTMVLTFGEKNPGMSRVMVGDGLVFEHVRLQARMNQFFDKIESSFKQALRTVHATSATPTVDTQAHAGVLTAFVIGRLQRYARSGFKKMPTENLDAALAFLL